MSSVRGRCVICTSTFISNNIAALHCGHTFHFDCVSKWVERSKTCPICRIRTTDRQIIKHLYFDTPDEFNTTQIINNDVQVETLSIALEKERSDHLDALEEILKLKDSVSSLQTKLNREKTRFHEKVPSLEARNRQLEMMLTNQQELEKTLEKTRSRLRACEFYKAVTAGKDENAVDKYLRDDGSVEVGQFLNILRRQLQEARKLQVTLTSDLRAERELLRNSKKKENELKNVVKALEQELRDVRSAANMSTSTPFNPKLKSFALDRSPSKRSSLGFNESVELNADVISSALRKRVPLHEKPVPSDIPKPLFADLSDNEDFASTSTADVSLQYPASLDKLRSPSVPKTLRERVMAGSGNNRSAFLGGAHRAAEKALENLELRNASAPEILRKPLTKRKFAENSTVNQRLSQFFHKKMRDTEVVDLED